MRDDGVTTSVSRVVLIPGLGGPQNSIESYPSAHCRGGPNCVSITGDDLLDSTVCEAELQDDGITQCYYLEQHSVSEGVLWVPLLTKKLSPFDR